MASPTRFPSGLWAGPKSTAVKTEAPIKQVSIPIRYTDGTGNNTTDFIFPPNSILWPVVLLNVRSPELTGTTKTIDVGAGGLAVDAILQKIGVDAAGVFKGSVEKALLTLGTELLVDGGVGADVANVPEPSVKVGNSPVTWAPGSADFGELEADIILFYQVIRSQPDG